MSENYENLRTLKVCRGQNAQFKQHGDIVAFNDDTLLPEHSWDLKVGHSCTVVLLPVAGAIEINTGSSDPVFVDSGESLTFHAEPGSAYRLTNPYPDRAINYLQITINESSKLVDELEIAAFDVFQKNTLWPASPPHLGLELLIGKYDGREEGIYKNEHLNRPIFVFIIEGVFEVQNRLLEKRDALMLWNVEELEFEALSQDAVILVAG